MLLSLALLLLLRLPGQHAVAEASPLKKNVLLIVCDDLRPEIGAYNHSHMITPHMDGLAKQSLLFERAFTNYAYCCPSRNSFMSGRMPGTSKVFNFINSFRDSTIRDRAGLPGTAWTTLPEHFKKNGFWTVGSGKLFHPNIPPHDDNPRSWSINYTDPGGNVGCGCPESGMPGSPMYCELPAGTQCPDVVVAQTVVGQLHEWKASHSDQPFFAGLGIHKPHLPWGAPKEFFDQYPPAAQLPLAQHKLVPVGMPAVAYHHCQWGPFPWNSSRGVPVADTIAAQARRGYYAAISFADHLLGTVLQALEDIGQEERTVVLLSSDHGWQLGEHNEWCKETVFELALRIPFMIRYPGADPAAVGGTTRVFAENIDIYKTLADLAGVPEVEEGVDGLSLAPLLRTPRASTAELLRQKSAAFGQHAHCLRDVKNNYAPIDPFVTADSCTVTPRDQLDWMGYSIRTDEWRYTEWVGWNGTSLQPRWDLINATELYSHALPGLGGATDQSFDAWENVNEASDPKHASVVAQLHAKLRTHFEHFALPYSNVTTASTTQDGGGE